MNHDLRIHRIIFYLKRCPLFDKAHCKPLTPSLLRAFKRRWPNIVGSDESYGSNESNNYDNLAPPPNRFPIKAIGK